MLTPDQIALAKGTASPAAAASTSQGMTPDQANAWITGSQAPAAPPAGGFHPLNDIADQAKSGFNQVKDAASEIGAGEDPLKAAESGLKAESGIASMVTAPLAPVMKPIGDIVQWLGEKIGSTQAAQDFVTQHPDAANALSRIATDASNAGNTAGTILGVDQVAKGVPKVIQGAKDLKAGVDATDSVANALTPEPGAPGSPEATAATAKQAAVKDAIDTEVRGLAEKYPTVGKVLNQAEVTSKSDPVSVLASYEGGKALPTIAKGKLQVDNATSFLKGQISRLSGIKSKLVETGKDVTPVEDFQTRANSIIDAKDGWSLAKKQAMKADTAKIVDSWSEIYPDGIPNKELDSLKTEHAAESTSYNSKSPFQPDAHAIVGQTARQLVETNAKDAPIEELNKLIQSHYDAIKLLNTMRGKAPHGGALSKMMNNTIGEVGGLGAGLAVGHPFIGAMVGRAGAEAINELINNNFISNPLKRSIVNNMKGVDPVVVQKALEFLDKQSGTEPVNDVSAPVNEGNAANDSQNSHAETVPPVAGNGNTPPVETPAQ